MAKHKPHGKWKAYLAENNISLDEISEVLGLSVQSISQKNNGKQNYTVSEINKLAEHFNVSMDIFRFEAEKDAEKDSRGA